MDIIKYRVNANKVMARTLWRLINEASVKLIDFEGGTLRNAIPREAFATVYVPEDKVELATSIVSQVESEVKGEYSVADPDGYFVFEPYQCAEGEVCDAESCKYVPEDLAKKYIAAIVAFPDGVERMSDAVPGLVETSNNMAVVKIEKGELVLKSLLRSSVDSAKEALAMKMSCFAEMIGAKAEYTGGYSGWAPNANSTILRIMKEVYKNMFGKEPAVMAIHAGLECGMLGGTYPNWDMISCGPTLLSPHSPDERANIPSVAKCWEFLKAVLENIPVK